MSGLSVDLASDNVRVDAETGATEVAEFYGEGRERIFGTRHMPAAPVVGGLVICSSIHAELLNSYRTEVLLARAVAARGIAVQRFHYRGHGHSDGTTEDVTFERMLEDAIAAAERLAGSGVGPTAFLGTRWGALVGAAAARRYDGAALALWEPVVSAEQFFREAFRSRLIRGLREGGAEPSRPDAVADEMKESGSVEVMGYPIDSALHASSIGRTLADELGDAPRPILVGQIGRAKEPRASYRKAMERWREAGFEVRLEILNQEEISWFLPNARRKQETRQPLIDATVDWLIDVSRGTASSTI